VTSVKTQLNIGEEALTPAPAGGQISRKRTYLSTPLGRKLRPKGSVHLQQKEQRFVSSL
jgi:hypothetical protein